MYSALYRNVFTSRPMCLPSLTRPTMNRSFLLIVLSPVVAVWRHLSTTFVRG